MPIDPAVERLTRLAGLQVFRQADWMERFPTLLQGITGRAPGLDFGFLDGPTPTADPFAGDGSPSNGWEALQRGTGIRRVARCRQVHGAAVARHLAGEGDGVIVLGEADGLVTDMAGVLLTVTVADCVPVYLVDPIQRVLGLAHAGWRGTAAGVVGATLRAMLPLGARLDSLCAHLGPAICGECYEVGPEVTSALGESPEEGRYVDLRGLIASQLRAEGLGPAQVTVSRHCTRCEDRAFYSYRAGDRGRRMCAFLGWGSR
ncbi:MAG: polyphenol oxidase family protein [Gemmatimonadota bacterium]|nr:MAG: polyphenol oxidase family protein [Gemmatimonadota bacterium]